MAGRDLPPSVERRDLWPTPIWEVDLAAALPEPAQLVADALGYLARNRLESFPLQQSSPDLAGTSPAWAAAGRVIEGVARGVAEQELRLGAGRTVVMSRCWVVRVDGPGDLAATSGTADLLHTHLPSILSSVLYLQLPSGFEGDPSVGTTFRAPTAAVARHLPEPTNVTVPARLHHLVLFPGWLEHAPAQPPSDRSFDRPRLVVAADFVLVG